MALGTHVPGPVRRCLPLLLVVALACGVSASAAAADERVTEVCRFTDDRFDEISGMTYSLRHPGVLWLHNDSSGGPYVYAVDAQTCRTLATLTITGIEARDIEAIAAGRDRHGRPVLWVADIGDNRDSWPSVGLHRIREPRVLVDRAVTPRTYEFTYRDRPHNAETLLVDPTSGQVWVVTRQLAHGRLYALPKRLSRDRVNVAVPVRREGGLVTDGAVSPDGSRYVLRDYVNATPFEGLPPGIEQPEVFLPIQPQGEAITWTEDGSALLIASERDDRLLRVELPVPGPETTGSPAPTPPGVTAGASPSPAPGASAPGPGPSVLVVAGLVAAAGLVIATAEWRRRRPGG